MKLKTCKNIEVALCAVKWMVVLPLLPLYVISFVFMVIGWAFAHTWIWMYETTTKLVWKISNKMTRNCDEVKEGKISSRYFIETMGAFRMYNWYKKQRT